MVHWHVSGSRFSSSSAPSHLIWQFCNRIRSSELPHDVAIRCTRRSSQLLCGSWISSSRRRRVAYKGAVSSLSPRASALLTRPTTSLSCLSLPSSSFTRPRCSLDGESSCPSPFFVSPRPVPLVPPALPGDNSSKRTHPTLCLALLRVFYVEVRERFVH